MRNTITRSFVKNACTCIVYKDGKTHEEIIVVPYGYNDTESADKYIRRKVSLDGKLVLVKSIEKTSALFGMDESQFIKLAKIVPERNKETRDFISKTVIGKVGTLVYMDKEYKVHHDKEVFVDVKRKLDVQAKELAPADCIGITIENIHDTEALYVLDESTFIANARPMRDHQHYINE